MAIADITAYKALFKTLFPDYAIKRVVYRNSPLFAILEKDENFFGDSMKMPVIIDGNAGYSPKLSTAITAADPTKSEAFVLTRNKMYGVLKIDREMMRASSDKKGAFASGMQVETEGLFYSLGRQFTFDLYGDGNGYLGFIGATTVLTGPTVVLANPNDVIWFQRGQLYQIGNPGTNTLRAATTLKVISVNRSAGTVTFDANINTVAGAALADGIVVADSIANRMRGLRAWLPTTVTATLFFGVDRTVDPVRLAGNTLDCSAAGNPTAVFDIIQELCKRTFREGGRPDVCVMHVDPMQKLLTYLEGKSVQIRWVEESMESVIRRETVAKAKRASESMDTSAGISDSDELSLKSDLMDYVPDQDAPVGIIGQAGFSGVKLFTQSGPLTVFADPACPSTDIFVLQTDTWKICSLDSVPAIIDEDGLDFLRSPTDDAFELRAVYMAQLGCKAPGFNGRAFNVPA